MIAGATSPTPHAAKFDAWFETEWGRHAFEIEYALIRRAIGKVAKRRVLDAGCGTARFAARLALSGALVTGVDRDLEMLRFAHTRIGMCVGGDALKLPFGANSFDAAVAITLCEFADALAPIADELGRVTRRGGRVVIGALNPKSPWGFRHRRRFSSPAWKSASFIDPDELICTLRQMGNVAVTRGLYSPGCALPRPVSVPLESLGRHLLPKLAAFQVVSTVLR